MSDFNLPEEIADEVTKMVLNALWHSPYQLDKKLMIQKWATPIHVQLDNKPKKKKTAKKKPEKEKELFDGY